MRKKDINKITEIIIKLVIRNMVAGADYDTAKAQAYNRMNTQYPTVLSAWLLDLNNENKSFSQ